MKHYNIVLALCFALVSTTTLAQEALETQKQQYSYAVGLQFAQQVKQQPGLDLDVPAFIQGIQDILNGDPPKLTMQQIQDSVNMERQKVAKALEEVATRNKQLGEEFLTENKARDGVNVTASGLQYEVMKEGAGKKPTADDTVVVHYKGMLLNGEEFDSSYKRNQPTTLPLKGVIPGWQEGLQLMSTGSVWKFFIPENLAYAERGAGGKIGPHETLVFEVELLEVK